MRQKLFILLFSISHLGYSQGLTSPSFYSSPVPDDSGEEIILDTDRSFYSINERMYFTARYSFKYPVDDVQWSNVIYVELIKWNGEKIAQAKFRLYENGASGFLEIPGTLLSGNYYLRAYTRWMRNFPVEAYAYKLVKIINPFESNIDQGPVQVPGKFAHVGNAQGSSRQGIDCSPDKAAYTQREKVTLTIGYDNPDWDDSDFCISVVKAASVDTSSIPIHFTGQRSPDEPSLTFLPELRGISISGKIIHTHTPGSTANARVHLSTPQDWKHFATFPAKDNGLFYFTIPDFYGRSDFYLDAVVENGERAEILIDNDYCNRSIQLGYVAFSLDSLEERIALEMVNNMQLSIMYHEESRIRIPESVKLPFYVSPTQGYDAGEYIQLPNLREFFFELVKEVRTVRMDKRTLLKITGYSPTQDLMPLVLIDNVPVVNVDEFLRIPLESIETVEIVDKPYMVSGVGYSGIICVSTTKKDFAGIELQKNSRFFSYDLLSAGQFNLPDYNQVTEDKITYRENLLFWDPDIELTSNHARTLSFYTSDSKGDYLVYIRSINNKGKPQVFGTCKIVVE